MILQKDQKHNCETRLLNFGQVFSHCSVQIKTSLMGYKTYPDQKGDGANICYATVFSYEQF